MNWDNVTAYARYQEFKVSSGAYKLTVSGYSGNAGIKSTDVNMSFSHNVLTVHVTFKALNTFNVFNEKVNFW